MYVKHKMMDVITTVQNPFIKKIKKLHQMQYRDEKKQFLVEGFHIVKEAVNSKFTIEQIIIREDVEIPEWLNAEKILYVSLAVFDVITQPQTPQGIAAIVIRFDLTSVNKRHVLLLHP